jgi:hypothetical protein
MFSSKELSEAVVSQSSITAPQQININLEQIKNDLRLFLLSRDKNLLKIYDVSIFGKLTSESGNQTLKSVLSLIRDILLQKNNEEKIKNLTIRKNFDIIFLCLENLSINNVEISSNEINTILLSFLNKNFLC